MKKIGNLNIDSEKLIDNEELINIRGGEEIFYCSFDLYGVPVQGPGYASNCTEAFMRILNLYPYANNICCDGCSCM